MSASIIHRNRLFLACASALAGCAFVHTAQSTAAAFKAGNLVVVRLGDGTTALASNTAVANLVEMNTTGAVTGTTVALPTTTVGASNALTINGTTTSEGTLTLNPTSQYLVLGGYKQSTGVASATATAGVKTIARVDYTGVADTTTSFTDTTGNFRSVTTNTGTQFWMGTSANGMRYDGTFGANSATTTQLSTTPTNLRVANIFNGQLYVSSASGTFLGISTIGSGLPTTSGQTTTTLSGFPTTGTHSNYDFAMNSAGTIIYVADDGTTANGGGIQRWNLSGSTWTLAYTLGTGATNVGARGLAVNFSGTNPVIYATTSESSANRVISITDTGSGSTATTLATAATNQIFRGVDFAPTSGSIGLTNNGGAGLGRTDVGNITTAGSLGGYSTTATTSLTSVASGYEDVLGTFPTPSTDAPAYVMLDLTVPGGGNVSDFLGALALDAGSGTISSIITSGAQFTALKSYYDGLFGKSFDAIVAFNQPAGGITAGNADVSWNFTAAGWGVNAIVVIPEPDELYALGALGLLSIRRRRIVSN